MKPLMTLLLTVSILISAFSAESTQGKDILLMPAPKQVQFQESSLALKSPCFIYLQPPVDDNVLRIGQHIRQSLKMMGINGLLTASDITGPQEIGVKATIDPNTENIRNNQGYLLKITPSEIRISARTAQGVSYAAQTLRQICEQSQEGGKLPCIEIADWPDYLDRGVMLDITRDKVPTMQTLYRVIDMLASWKINHVQLYIEHAFAYRNHKTVWEKASPITGEQILELDRYCRDRFIELVPNQNSFGHMERWLRHDRYRPLAELPVDYDGPIRIRSLCPIDPNSIALIEELYAEFLPHFTSQKFNVGCDETFELGKGRSKDICEQQGKGRVYLDYLLKVHKLCRKHGRTMMFWGDIILHYPELIGELPDDVIGLIWGYEADHDYDTQCAKFAESGIDFYVCPGTSSWCSIAGRTDNAIGNIANAVENGLKYNAKGFLLTDWGDHGHWQPLSVSYMPLAYGAGTCWAFEQNKDMNVVDVSNRLIFKDSTGITGRAFYDLGNVYQYTEILQFNGTVMYRLLQYPDLQTKPHLFKDLTVEKLQKALDRIGQVNDRINHATPHAKNADLILDEFRLCARLLRHACRLGMLRVEPDAVPPDEPNKLTADMKAIMAEHRRIWLSRNRPGGLTDSLARMQDIIDTYQDPPARSD